MVDMNTDNILFAGPRGRIAVHGEIGQFGHDDALNLSIHIHAFLYIDLSTHFYEQIRHFWIVIAGAVQAFRRNIVRVRISAIPSFF